MVKMVKRKRLRAKQRIITVISIADEHSVNMTHWSYQWNQMSGGCGDENEDSGSKDEEVQHGNLALSTQLTSIDNCAILENGSCQKISFCIVQSLGCTVEIAVNTLKGTVLTFHHIQQHSSLCCGPNAYELSMSEMVMWNFTTSMAQPLKCTYVQFSQGMRCNAYKGGMRTLAVAKKGMGSSMVRPGDSPVNAIKQEMENLKDSGHREGQEAVEEIWEKRLMGRQGDNGKDIEKGERGRWFAEGEAKAKEEEEGKGEAEGDGAQEKNVIKPEKERITVLVKVLKKEIETEKETGDGQREGEREGQGKHWPLPCSRQRFQITISCT
ncbi:hypothetical protein OG21DRAFT_1526706 [Imleria badia]|nr:hypothetical protein OG21DRAFT_1526706 [Imleria badia]